MSRRSVPMRRIADRTIRARLGTMKRRIAWLFAGLSGIYLLTAGPFPDPLPLVDEGVALLVFVKSMACLGYDVRRWLPFPGMRGKRNPSPQKSCPGVTIDV